MHKLPTQRLPSVGAGVRVRVLQFFSFPTTVSDSHSLLGNMRVHPTLRKRNMAFGPAVLATGPLKKLRRLPHIFSKVLELPFCADADVHVEEDATAFRFVAAIAVGASFRTQFIEIHPGMMKLVVRNDDGFDEDELELDRWRFRLPPSTRPALATVECIDRELIVRVPKGAVIDKGR